MAGIADPALLALAEAFALVEDAGEDEDSVRPGATADTSAAKPAVSAAAPAIVQRRVSRTRANAASRSSMARDRSGLRCSGFESIIATERISTQ
jgi:hypothetical protein